MPSLSDCKLSVTEYEHPIGYALTDGRVTSPHYRFRSLISPMINSPLYTIITTAYCSTRFKETESETGSSLALAPGKKGFC